MTEKTYNLERLNILVVDDSKHMRSLISAILRALGVNNVLEAADGASALKELRHFPADIIITDWSMTPLDGLDFTRMVRTAKDSLDRFVPIIMLTGYAEMNRVQEARDIGIHEFLAKPVSAASLYSRIKAIIERPRTFIQTAGKFAYFGPDRRRSPMSGYAGAENRKQKANEVAATF